MIKLSLLNIIIISLFVSCSLGGSNNQETKKKIDLGSKSEIIKTKNKSEIETEKTDKQKIRDLIRNVLNWSDTKTNFDLYPVISDDLDSIYIGISEDKLKDKIKMLQNTNYFSSEFIENYNKIIQTIGKELTDNTTNYKWFVGEMPPFNFASDLNPWTLCQDIPYEKPNPWDLIEIDIINLNDKKGEIIWKWGNINSESNSFWKDFSYRFNVVKENGVWKISYLQGFDYDKIFNNK